MKMNELLPQSIVDLFSSGKYDNLYLINTKKILKIKSQVCSTNGTNRLFAFCHPKKKNYTKTNGKKITEDK